MNQPHIEEFTAAGGWRWNIRSKAEARSRGIEKLDSTFSYTSHTAKVQIRYTLRYTVVHVQSGILSQSDKNKKKIPRSETVNGLSAVTSLIYSNVLLIKLVTELCSPLQTGEWSHWSNRLSYRLQTFLSIVSFTCNQSNPNDNRFQEEQPPSGK